jgi:hypothetical protein
MRWQPGTPDAYMETVFVKEDGSFIDPVTVMARITDSEGTVVLDWTAATRMSLGTFRISFAIAEDAPQGLWNVDWDGTLADGLHATGSEIFEVETADVTVTPSPELAGSRLRSRLGESKTDPNGDGSETMFKDEAIFDMIDSANGDIDLATVEGWRRKSAYLQRLVDISESGADRSMSQKFKQAKAMLDYWSKIVVDAAIASQMALSGRVVGQVISLREDQAPVLQTPFSGFSEHIREYPTKRLLIPALMR